MARVTVLLITSEYKNLHASTIKIWDLLFSILNNFHEKAKNESCWFLTVKLNVGLPLFLYFREFL